MTFLPLYPQVLAQDLVINKYLLNNLTYIKFKTLTEIACDPSPKKRKTKQRVNSSWNNSLTLS